MMKHKKIEIYRPQYDCWTCSPIRARLSKVVLTLEVRDKDGFLIGVFKGYHEAAEALGINEKTVRNIRAKKFATSRSGYTITAVEKGGVAV